ncbi:MAG: argininosuccinate lyase, partial [Clostridia bacterium]|nr:argininosuccinate lyase [Clostridia bacterium]
VFYCIEHNTDLLSLSLDEFKTQSDLFEADIYNAISLETCVEKRLVEGGPSRVSVEKQIKTAEDLLNRLK